MANDTEITIPTINGVGATVQQLSGQNPSGAVAPETLLRANGAMVGAGAPLPVQQTALPGQATPAASPSLVLKAAAGQLFSMQLSSSASGWFLLLDAPSVPANGAASPRRAWQYATGGLPLDLRFDPPLQMETGAVVAFSSTGPFTLTLGGATAFICGEIV